ncbi:MAG: cytochrome C biogenesis protein, partial [Bacteroidetes bacterium]
MGIQKVIMRLFSTSAAGLYMLLFAAAIGVATFIENDFGTSAAQKVVFRAWWFELLLVLFAISLLVNVYRYRMFQRRKWALLTFHLAMVIILIGAGVTRYFGYEGMMHIREGSASNHFLSRETYLLFEVQKDGKKYQFHEPVLFASLGDNHWEESYLLGGQALEVEVLEFIPNPKEVLRDDENGVPVLKIVMGGANGREEYYLKEGDRRRIRGTLFNFSNLDVPQAVNIRREGEQLFVKLPEPYTLTVMATQQRENLPAGVFHPLKLRSLYAGRNSSFVFGLYTPRGRVEIASASPKMESSSLG